MLSAQDQKAFLLHNLFRERGLGFINEFSGFLNGNTITYSEYYTEKSFIHTDKLYTFHSHPGDDDSFYSLVDIYYFLSSSAIETYLITNMSVYALIKSGEVVLPKKPSPITKDINPTFFASCYFERLFPEIKQKKSLEDTIMCLCNFLGIKVLYWTRDTM